MRSAARLARFLLSISFEDMLRSDFMGCVLGYDVVKCNVNGFLTDDVRHVFSGGERDMSPESSL